jgi:hypothetical protein
MSQRSAVVRDVQGGYGTNIVGVDSLLVGLGLDGLGNGRFLESLGVHVCRHVWTFGTKTVLLSLVAA